MKDTDLDTMEHVLRKLQDVQNSQKALVEKIASIQIELFDHPDKALEAALEKVAGSASEGADLMNQAIEQFEMQVNREEQSVGPAPAEPTE